MSLELRNRLESTLGIRLTATLLFTYPSTALLAESLVARFQPSAVTAPPPAPAVEDSALVHSVAQLSERETEAAIFAELAELEEYVG